jgi:hypothetical protein
MFAFSLSKLVVLVGVAVAVWYGFKLVARVQELREAEARRRAKDARGAERLTPEGSSAVEDTVKCRVCQAYVPARGARGCGQPGCPYGA